MRARREPFVRVELPSRRDDQREARVRLEPPRLTPDDVHALAAALGITPADPRVASARTELDKGAAYYALREYQFQSERPSLTDLRSQADRLRVAASEFLRAALELDAGTDLALFTLMSCPQFPRPVGGVNPTMRHWSPWLRQVRDVQNAADNLYELTLPPNDANDLAEAIGFRVHGRGRFKDPRSLKVACVAVACFERFAASGRGVSVRRARLVEIVMRRFLGNELGQSEFEQITRRALLAVRKRGRASDGARAK